MDFFDTTSIIESGGYLALFGFLFAETGLLIGIFLPGESLLFAAGILASSGFLNLPLVMLTAFVAGVLGDSTGYTLGKMFGYDYFRRHPKLGLTEERIARVHGFYEKYGARTLIIARFVPFLRTIVPVLAGIGLMEYRKFLTYNVIGAAIWAVSITLIGYGLGELVPEGHKYEGWITTIIIVLCLFPLAYTIFGKKAGQ